MDFIFNFRLRNHHPLRTAHCVQLNQHLLFNFLQSPKLPSWLILTGNVINRFSSFHEIHTEAHLWNINKKMIHPDLQSSSIKTSKALTTWHNELTNDNSLSHVRATSVCSYRSVDQSPLNGKLVGSPQAPTFKLQKVWWNTFTCYVFILISWNSSTMWWKKRMFILSKNVNS